MVISKFETHDFITDTKAVLAVGSAKLKGKVVRARFRVDLLKRAINILEELGDQKIDFVFAEDNPLMIGQLNKKKKIVAGVFIAPIVEQEE